MSPIVPDALSLPPRTVFRPGAAAEALPACATLGPRGLLVHGRSLERSGALERLAAQAPQGLSLATWRHPGGEPTLDHIEAALAVARREQAAWVLGIGGGSVLDVAKACAGLLRATRPVADYHNGAPVPEDGIPFAAVPTTAGTGSEATTVCVVTNPATREKKSFRHPNLMARLVVLDPELLLDCPPAVVAASGMDAFTQAVESFLSAKSSWLTEQLSLKAAALVAGSLERAFRGGDIERLSNLLLGSYLAGVALSHARLGLVHGLAHPLGQRLNLPHGAVCAACLPAVLAYNRPACPGKYERLREALGVEVELRTRQLIEVLKLGNPLAGHTVADRAAFVKETLASGSTAANPRPVASADVERLLDELLAAPASVRPPAQ